MQQNVKSKKIKGQGLKFALVVSCFNPQITQGLKRGCLKALRESKVREKNIEIFEVPGAFEIPLVAQKLAQSKRYDAIICLGAVIKGETPHFHYLAHEAARGIGEVARQFNLPVLFGILTCYTLKQAQDRSQDNQKNKGRETAYAALEVAYLIRNMSQRKKINH